MAASITTAGGCSFEQLCQGSRPNYVCDPSCLVNLTNVQDIDRATYKIKDELLGVIRNLECETGRSVNKFYIGKTFIKRRRRTTFNVKNPNTWKKNGISSRWHDHKSKDYGKNGLVVLAAITKDCVPKVNHKIAVNQEQYALALEQRLLHHFKISQADERLDNISFATGRETSLHCIGYAVYVAFSLDDENRQDFSIESAADSIQHSASPEVSITGHTSAAPSSTNHATTSTSTATTSTSTANISTTASTTSKATTASTTSKATTASTTSKPTTASTTSKPTTASTTSKATKATSKPTTASKATAATTVARPVIKVSIPPLSMIPPIAKKPLTHHSPQCLSSGFHATSWPVMTPVRPHTTMKRKQTVEAAEECNVRKVAKISNTGSCQITCSTITKPKDKSTNRSIIVYNADGTYTKI